MKLLTAALLLSSLMAAGPLAADDAPRPAGPLKIQTLAGTTVDVKGLAGKPVLVMFFSTDCPHCQATTRILGPIYQEYHAKGYEFVGVALNPTASDNLKTFVDTYAVRFPVGLGGRDEFVGFTGIADRFYFPYLFFVDAQGRISEQHQGSDRAFFADPAGSIRRALDRLHVGS